MSIEYIPAQDEVFGIAKTAFDAAIQELTPWPKLYFPGDIYDPPAADQMYAICSFVVVIERQASLAQIAGVSLWESVSLFTLQVYAPKIDVQSFRNAQTIASAVRDAFRKPSPSGEITFTNQRATPVTGNDTRNQVNVLVTATYKTAK